MIDVSNWWKLCLPGALPSRHREFAAAHFAPAPGERADRRELQGSECSHRSEHDKARVRRLARAGFSTYKI